MPKASDIRRYEQGDKIMVNNDDGLLDVPEALIPKKHGRIVKMVTLTAADKIKAKIALAEERAARQAAIQARLKKELEEAEEEAKFMASPELTVQEMRDQLRD